MSAALPRRAILRGLTSLPLIGGSVALIGLPTASAVPISKALLDSYDAWLEYERRYLQWERYRNTDVVRRLSPPFRSEMEGFGAYDLIPCDNAGAKFHDQDIAAPSARAALVLSAVGCDWANV